MTKTGDGGRWSLSLSESFYLLLWRKARGGGLRSGSRREEWKMVTTQWTFRLPRAPLFLKDPAIRWLKHLFLREGCISQACLWA